MARKRPRDESETGPPATPKTAEDLLKVFKERLGHKDKRITTTTISSNLESLWCGKDTTLTRIHDTVTWVGQLKAQASLFGNWLVLYLRSNNTTLPDLSDAFYTQLFAAVTGRRSKFTHEYAEFLSRTLPPGTQPTQLPWLKNTSQILNHAKNEMATVAKTALTEGFYMRRLAVMRWKIVDGLSNELLTMDAKERKNLLHRISKRVMDGNSNWQGINLPADKLAFLTSLVEADQARLAALDVSIRSRIEAKFISAEVTRLTKPASDKAPMSQSDALVQALEKFEGLTRAQLIKRCPIVTISYFYDHMHELESLPLTLAWEASLQVKKKEDRQWPWWKKLKYPRFSPLPFNKLSRQFIRIDQRTLKDWGIKPDPDKWWLSNLIDIYKKSNWKDPRGKKERGRVHPFAQWRHLVSPEVTLSNFSTDDFKPHERPRLPGQSFSTDGVTACIPVLTLESPHEHLDGLMKRGYTGIPRKEERAELSELSGIQRLESARITTSTSNGVFVGVDPGLVKPVAWARLDGESWGPNKPPPETAALAMANTGSYSTAELLRDTKRDRFKKLEVTRRNTNLDYNQACTRLCTGGVVKKTFSLHKMTEYAKARAEADPLRVSELMNIHRSVQRRIRFRRTQRTISHIVHKMTGEPSRAQRRWYKKQYDRPLKLPRYVFFFGRALFHTTKGRVSVPRKAIIRGLVQKGLVLLSDEYNTSKLCPIDYSILIDAEEKRVRQCPTDNHGAQSTWDRDEDIGASNILQKSLYELCGKPIAAFYPSETESDESSDEDSDEEDGDEEEYSQVISIAV